jgi:EAL domain-containing protein (putative c-di-GMP-specific phosphodiesterase class I)
MGCDTVQGFVFCEPMFEQEFLAWTHSGRSRTAKSVA